MGDLGSIEPLCIRVDSLWKRYAFFFNKVVIFYYPLFFYGYELNCFICVLMMISRLGTTGFMSNSFESLSSSTLMKSFPTVVPIAPRKQLPDNTDPARKTNLCNQCSQNYEQELAKHVPKNLEKPSTDDVEATNQQSLPPWLKNATTNDQSALCPVLITTDYFLTLDWKTELFVFVLF